LHRFPRLLSIRSTRLPPTCDLTWCAAPSTPPPGNSVHRFSRLLTIRPTQPGPTGDLTWCSAPVAQPARRGCPTYPVWGGERTASQPHARLWRPCLAVARREHAAEPGTVLRHTRRAARAVSTTYHRRRARAITVPYLSTSSTPATHVPIPYSLGNTVPPLLISFYYCTPCSPLSYFPLALFLGARLSFEARYPAGGCGPDRRGAPQRAIALWRSRGLCPSRGGPTAGLLEWPPHRVGGLHCALSLVTPPAGACVRVSPIAHLGERGWLVQRGVSLFLGPTAGIYESPAHRVGRLDFSFELVTPPVGACRTRPYCPHGRLRVACTAGCVPFAGADRWMLRVAGTPGGPA